MGNPDNKPRIIGQDGNNFRCPICKKVLPGSREVTFPFCSERCKLVDLSKWMDGSYFTSRPVDPSDEVETMPRNDQP